MTPDHDEFIKLAQECQLIGMRPHLDGIYQEALELFAKLVAAAEREACAVIAETAADCLQNSTFNGVANAIRARGKT